MREAGGDLLGVLAADVDDVMAAVASGVIDEQDSFRRCTVTQCGPPSTAAAAVSLPTERAQSVDNWSFRSATELVATYRARAASPVEVAREVLERIGKLDREVNAFCLVDADAAIASAGESERRWLRGEPCGPLDGVPTSIKDVLLTRGWPTRRGSRTVDPDQPWDVDAPATARLREAGAVLIGKTTSPEFGWKGVTDSPLTGTTRNPWAPSQTAGGSSGGSAAAVALGLGPLSLGTDGGGSVRIPAAFCGVFALKPTYGRIPHYPPSPFGDLVHVGPITRTVDDAALLLDTLARPDSRDWSALAAPATSFVAALRGGVHGLRVAFSPALGYVTVHPEVAAAVRAAVQVFERLGAGVEEVDPGFANPIDAFTVLWNAGAARLLATVRQSAQHHVDPGLREIGAIGATYTADQYLDAVAQRMDIGSRMGVFHDRYDLLLTPTLPIPAFEAGREAPSGSTDPRWTGWTPFTYPFNLTQQPAATLPCGRTSDGLPIGLQVIAPRHADAMVLAACKAFQDACPSTRDWPPLADSWR